MVLAVCTLPIVLFKHYLPIRTLLHTGLKCCWYNCSSTVSITGFQSQLLEEREGESSLGGSRYGEVDHIYLYIFVICGITKVAFLQTVLLAVYTQHDPTFCNIYLLILIIDICGALIAQDLTLIPVRRWASNIDLSEDIKLFRNPAAGFDKYANFAVFLCANCVTLLQNIRIRAPGHEPGNAEARWSELFGHLEDWYSQRPEEMKPILTIPAIEGEGKSPFPTVLYGNGPAVSGNQLYHTASLIMLEAKPRSIHLQKKQVCDFKPRSLWENAGLPCLLRWTRNLYSGTPDRYVQFRNPIRITEHGQTVYSLSGLQARSWVIPASIGLFFTSTRGSSVRRDGPLVGGERIWRIGGETRMTETKESFPGYMFSVEMKFSKVSCKVSSK